MIQAIFASLALANNKRGETVLHFRFPSLNCFDGLFLGWAIAADY